MFKMDVENAIREWEVILKSTCVWIDCHAAVSEWMNSLLSLSWAILSTPTSWKQAILFLLHHKYVTDTRCLASRVILSRKQGCRNPLSGGYQALCLVWMNDWLSFIDEEQRRLRLHSTSSCNWAQRRHIAKNCSSWPTGGGDKMPGCRNCVIVPRCSRIRLTLGSRVRRSTLHRAEWRLLTGRPEDRQSRISRR